MGVVLLIVVIMVVQQSQGYERPFLGWEGETYNPPDKDRNEQLPKDPHLQQQRPRAMLKETEGSHGHMTKVFPGQKVISWEPRLFHYPNIISDEECDHIIRTAIPTLKRSVVYDKDGKLIVNKMRTSYGTFLRRLKDPIVRNITSRVAEITHVPASHQEDLQVLRYAHNQEYQAHVDSQRQTGSDARASTFILYLSDVEEGGETVFVKTSLADPDFEAEYGPFSPCAKGQVAVRPKKGDGVLFYSATEDGSLDPNSEHAGCPVIKGTKWTATIWSHTVPFRPYTFHVPTKKEEEPDPGYCEDYDAKCGEWAKEGECEKNPIYMVGDGGDLFGACRLSCGACKVCQEGDKSCYTANRDQANYLTIPETFETAKYSSS